MVTLKSVSVHSREDMHGEGNPGRDWSVLRQHLAALLACLASLSAGLYLGWSSPALPVLQGDHTDVELPLRVSEEQGSWISCLLPLGAAVGSLPAGKFSELVGRKKAVLSLAVPLIAGWLFILFANDSVVMVYAGRFIGGVGTGAGSVLIAQYNEEIAEDAIRGSLGVYLDFCQVTGLLVMNIFSAFMTYMWFTSAACIVPVIFFCCFIFMPESPIYLLIKNREEDAKKSLMWLRHGKKCYDPEDEVILLREYLSEHDSNNDTRSLFERVRGVNLKSVTLRSAFIVFGLMFFQQAGGINGILFNAVSVFEDAGTGMSAYVSSAVLGVIACLSDFSSSLYVDRLGRRPMLLISSLVTTVCVAILSAYFHFLDTGVNMRSWNWVPLTSLVIFTIAFTAGLSPLPWLLNAELIPTKHQSWICPLASSFNWTMAFVVTKVFPDMVIHLGNDGTYLVFACMSMVGAVFVWFFVPETKGKSRQEIEDMLIAGRK